MTKDCPHCGLNLPDPDSTVCPSCGRKLDAVPPAWETSLGPVRRYFHDLWQIMSRPTLFFRRMPLSGGWSIPLAFALVSHWIGTSFQFLWHKMLGGTLGDYVNHLFRVAGNVAEVDHPGRGAMMLEMRDRLLHWMWGAGSILLDPFLTLISILFTTSLVFLGARLLVTPGKNGSPNQITYESALRIICFGMSPAVLAAIPLLGGMVSRFWIVVVTVIGAREVYRVSTGRAIVVGLFPKILLMALGLAAFVMIVALFFRFVATAF